MKMSDFNFYVIQKILGYSFKNPTLLKQAFTNPSVTTASCDRIQNYQVLEFIGDSVLSLAVVKNFTKEFCKIDNEGQMICKTNEKKLSSLRQDFIKNETLAHCSKVLGLDKYIIRDYYHLSSDYKTKKGDIVESILGALALDCNWDFQIICSVVKNILKYKNIDVNYFEKIENFCQKRHLPEPNYAIYKRDDCFECYVSIPNANQIFKSQSDSELSAINKASKEAWIFLLKDDVSEYKEINSIAELNIMNQKKLISKPIYNFELIQENTQNIWKCYATLEDLEYEFCSESTSKKEAKQLASNFLLNYIENQKTENNSTKNGLLKLIMTKYQSYCKESA